MVKKNKARKAMDCGDDCGTKEDCTKDEFCYSNNVAVPDAKKKRVIKLSRKQIIRKQRKKSMGETLVDRRDRKTERDSRKLDRKLIAKSLW